MTKLGFHDSTEQSQFMHGSSIDEGPTSPRGIHWGTEKTTGRGATNRSGMKEEVPDNSIRKCRKNCKNRHVTSKGEGLVANSSRKELAPKNVINVGADEA